MTYENGVWKYFNGEIASDVMLPWKPGQPDNRGGKEHCAEVMNDSMELNDVKCDVIYSNVKYDGDRRGLCEIPK